MLDSSGQKGSPYTGPTSLLQLCINLVATNLDLVESFHSLPSLIGENIFSVACNAERLKTDVQYSTQAVRLYADAYGQEFLSCLNLKGCHLGLNYCLEQIVLFRDLVQLDLSYCGLGDDHEMLAQFEHLTRTEILSWIVICPRNLVGARHLRFQETKTMLDSSGQKGSPYTGPTSLLQLCINLVATNLDLVESFHSLPSLIGENIFSVACNAERLKTDVQYSTQAVRLYADAYGQEFLSCLNLKGCHLGLNYCLEQIVLFRDLVQLDLSYCGLGDDHEMLAQFEHLTRLEVLYVRGNALSNAGVQKMTLPYRMFSRGPDRLMKVDLRANEGISRECLKFFNNFTSLGAVLLSENTDIQLGTYKPWTLSVSDGNEYEAVTTRGWAKVMIDRWMTEAEKKSVQPKQRKTNGFFSIRKQPVSEQSNIKAKIQMNSRCIVARRSCGEINICTKEKEVYKNGEHMCVPEIEEDNDKKDQEQLHLLYQIPNPSKPCSGEKGLLEQLDSWNSLKGGKVAQTDMNKWASANIQNRFGRYRKKINNPDSRSDTLNDLPSTLGAIGSTSSSKINGTELFSTNEKENEKQLNQMKFCKQVDKLGHSKPPVIGGMKVNKTSLKEKRSGNCSQINTEQRGNKLKDTVLCDSLFSDTKSYESKSSDIKSYFTKSLKTCDSKSFGSDSFDTKLGKSESCDFKLGNSQSCDFKLGNSKFCDSKLGNSKSSDSKLGNINRYNFKLGDISQSPDATAGISDVNSLDSHTIELTSTNLKQKKRKRIILKKNDSDGSAVNVDMIRAGTDETSGTSLRDSESDIHDESLGKRRKPSLFDYLDQT